ncbi:MAG: Mur ligase domain-containing protein, partial [Desulfobacteraceae bacterium]|nr:Mur ligase domain-containing protein [Desulfobacteraceae bacterium]
MTEPSESLNIETVRHVHLIAICGTAMGALACMLQELGYTVTGSDQHVYPPMSDFLRAKGIQIFEGFSEKHLASRPDLVVVGNAVSKTNPEAQAMQAMELPYCSMPQAINRFAAAGKKQIVITGTHGKTTTSSFIAWMLQCAGLDPSFLIGGILADFQSNYKVGQGDWIVLEGDEYDTAYFDKGPKFLHYTPEVAVR